MPLALPPCLPTELLTYILAQQSYPTFLLICSTRAAFLSQLLQAASLPVPARPVAPQPASPLQEPDLDPGPDTESVAQPPQSQEDSFSNHEPNDAIEQAEESPGEESSLPPSREASSDTPYETQHHLLTPTLAQVVSSRHIHLSFLPTLSHLRAHLSVFPSPTASPPSAPRFDNPGKHTAPLLCVYGLMEAHKDTSEWSAQGLGSTVATLVDAGIRARMRIVLIESKNLEEHVLEAEREDEVGGVDEEQEGEDRGEEDVGSDGEMGTPQPRTQIGSEGQRRKGEEEVWKQRVPMLSGSTRRSAPENTEFGSRGGAALAWSGRTVEVGNVLKRWCRFGKGEWW